MFCQVAHHLCPLCTQVSIPFSSFKKFSKKILVYYVSKFRYLPISFINFY